MARLSLTRRAVALGGVAGVAGIVGGISAVGRGFRPMIAGPLPTDVTLVYVGAEDCAPCRRWQAQEAIAFRRSAKFARVSLREVKSATLFDVLKDENWRGDLRPYRDLIQRGAGVPLWLVVADGQVVLQGAGETQWRSVVLPKIESLL